MPHMSFTEDDLSFLAEMLRIAEVDLQLSIDSLTWRWPDATFTETLRRYRERAQDLRAQIEGR